MAAAFLFPGTARTISLDYCLASLAPASPYGQSARRAMQPYLPGQEEALDREFSAVEVLLAQLNSPEPARALSRIYHLMAQLPDWRETLHRAAAGSTLSDPEFFGLKQTIYFLQEIARTASPHSIPVGELPMDSLAELSALLDPEKSGSPAFYIADAYSPELAAVRARLREHQRNLLTLKEQTEREATQPFGLATNPAGEVVVSRLDEAMRDRLDDSNLFSLNRETYTDAYYAINPSPAETRLQKEITRLRDKENDLEEEVRHRLSRQVRTQAASLYRAIEAVARFDLTLARARLAKEWDAVRPTVLSDRHEPCFSFSDARHPKVAAELAAEERSFTPISLNLGKGLAVITGANMGGKTVALRTIGLLAALTAYGCFVPARAARLTLFGHIAILAGDYSADFHDGLSRFGQEVVALREMLKLQDSRSLLLIDELAASTNPFEGSALAVAVAEYLDGHNSVAVLTTHYDLLKLLQDVPHWQVVGLSRVPGEELRLALDPAEGDITVASLMDYTLRPVDAGRNPPREAIRVARHLKLPAEIINRALDLTTIEQGGNKHEQD